MNLIEEVEAGVFRVEFRALQSLVQRVTRAEVVVDPYSVARVLDSVMQQAQQRSVQGKVLVWNEYRMFLARSDHEGLEAVAADISVDLERVLAKRLRSMDGEIVGERMYARLLADEAGDVRPGTAIVRASFLPDEEEAEAPVAGEVTVRFQPNRGGTETGEVEPLTPATDRIDEPDHPPDSPARGRPTVWVSWEGGRERLAVGLRYTLGRPHDVSMTGFVSLEGASTKISRRHVWIEVQADGLKIGRPSDANPVQVDGQLITPGGEMYCGALPVTVSLSRGALELCLEPIGG